MTDTDSLSVNAVRVLAAEMIQKAKSGHPGLPLGAAPAAYTLFSRRLKFNPIDPRWRNRDRFVLSAGHGSALLYSLLHIYGYGLTMDDIKQFRQLDSKTPGHPEFGHTTGVEITTGPLGQGIANGVGMAIAQAHTAAVFNREGYPVCDHYTYVLAGDGCLMEGISSEASSLAGTLGLGRLIVLYDSNNITIEGDTKSAFTEDVLARYAAYGWQTIEVKNGDSDSDAIDAAISEAQADTERPTLIKIDTTIGFGSLLAGKAACHGSPLGDEGIAALRETLGYKGEPFTVPRAVYDAANAVIERNAKAYDEYNEMLMRYTLDYPELAQQYSIWNLPTPQGIFNSSFYSFDKPMATRKASSVALNRLAEKLPNLIGGSADLGSSNLSIMTNREWFSRDNYAGSNIHFGVREFAMAAIANGIAVYGGLKPYVATFFVFSDYLKHGIRLSALMGLPVLYILTHDSIGVGEDGPTHQPIEQLATLRAMPGVYTWRPADAHETAAAYEAAFTLSAPTALALSRQELPLLDGSGKDALCGGYILKDAEKPQAILIGTGSEVSLCIEAAKLLDAEGIATRVVSMPCTELFDEQDDEYRAAVLPAGIPTVAVEAASPFGWYKYASDVIGMESFGASAPAGKLFERFGFTAENVAKRVRAALK